MFTGKKGLSWVFCRFSVFVRDDVRLLRLSSYLGAYVPGIGRMIVCWWN